MKEVKKEKAVIFDVDGTLFDVSKRLELAEASEDFWKTFLDPDLLDLDAPREEMVDLAREWKRRGYRVILLTGRPPWMLEKTLKRLKEADVPFDSLFIRAEGMTVPDTVFKEKVIRELILPRFEVVQIYDDLPHVVKHLQEKFPDIPIVMVRLAHFSEKKEEKRRKTKASPQVFQEL